MEILSRLLASGLAEETTTLSIHEGAAVKRPVLASSYAVHRRVGALSLAGCSLCCAHYVCPCILQLLCTIPCCAVLRYKGGLLSRMMGVGDLRHCATSAPVLWADALSHYPTGRMSLSSQC